MKRERGGIVGAQVAQFYNGKPKQSIQERENSDYIEIRKFNNFIKSILITNGLDVASRSRNVEGIEGIDSARGLKVLELCGGTGGDLPKYFAQQNNNNTRLSEYVLIDIANDSVKEAERRYIERKNRQNGNNNKSLVFNARFITQNAFDPSLVRKAMKPDDVWAFDMVSCQFALHYAFCDIDSAKGLFCNISNYLRPGGSFIATFPNAEYIIEEHLQVRNTDSVHYNDNKKKYKIVKESKEEDVKNKGVIDNFGQSYTFSMGEMVQNVPEFLVYRDTFEKLANDAGLQLITWEPFQTYYSTKTLDPTYRDLAVKLQVLPEAHKGNLLPAESAWETAKLYVAVELQKPL